MNITVESIHAMSPTERSKALGILSRSPLMLKTKSGQELIALINYLGVDDVDDKSSGVIGDNHVTIGAGQDGKFGTSDDTVVVKPKKKKLFF